MKKLVALILVVVLAIALTVPALAATPADSIVAKLQELQTKYASNAAAVNQLDNAIAWLKTDPAAKEITSASATKIIASINSAVSTAASATALSQISTEDQAKIIADVRAAAAVLGWTVEINAGGVAAGFVVKDADGNVVAVGGTSNPIKQTGIDTSLLITLIIGITLLFGAAVIVAITTRNKRVANEA